MLWGGKILIYFRLICHGCYIVSLVGDGHSLMQFCFVSPMMFILIEIIMLVSCAQILTGVRIMTSSISNPSFPSWPNYLCLFVDPVGHQESTELVVGLRILFAWQLNVTFQNGIIKTMIHRTILVKFNSVLLPSEAAHENEPAPSCA